MKKILTYILLVLLSFSLTGCTIERITTTSTNEDKNVKTYLKENEIDKEAIISEIYEKVYEQIETDLREEIKEELLEEYGESITLDTLQDEIYRVVLECTAANVQVVNRQYNTSGELVAAATGSGVIFKKATEVSKDAINQEDLDTDYTRYYLITNQHVVEDGKGFYVEFSDESVVDAYLIGADETTDIALLYFDSKNTYGVAKLGDSDETNVGEIVLAIGNPKGETLFSSVTMGIIGGKNRNLLETTSSGSTTRNTIVSYLQHDAAINSGNSGGGLFNLDCECIGINSVKYAASDIEGLNFSIPINLVKKVIDAIENYGEYNGNVSLGITCSEVSAFTETGRTQYNIPEDVTSGIVVITVDETGSAYGALEEYDIIIEMDSVTIESTKDVRSVLDKHIIGETINVKVIRDGVETTVSITFKRNSSTN